MTATPIPSHFGDDSVWWFRCFHHWWITQGSFCMIQTRGFMKVKGPQVWDYVSHPIKLFREGRPMLYPWWMSLKKWIWKMRSKSMKIWKLFFSWISFGSFAWKNETSRKRSKLWISFVAMNWSSCFNYGHWSGSGCTQCKYHGDRTCRKVWIVSTSSASEVAWGEEFIKVIVFVDGLCHSEEARQRT